MNRHQLVNKFWKIYGSQRFIPCSEEPAVETFLEPDESCSHTQTYFIKVLLNIILPSIPWSPRMFLPLGFPIKISCLITGTQQVTPRKRASYFSWDAPVFVIEGFVDLLKVGIVQQNNHDCFLQAHFRSTIHNTSSQSSVL